MEKEVYRPNYAFGFPLQKDFAKGQSLGRVGVIMGSRSDWDSMYPCTDMLEEFQISFEYGVVSAHRTSERMVKYANIAADRGLQAIIACAGGSAHLPGMVSSDTRLPVYAVAPLKTDEHAVGSMIAMPTGIPVGYMGGGSGVGKNAGATNAALQVARVLAVFDEEVRERLIAYINNLRESVPHTCF